MEIVIRAAVTYTAVWLVLRVAGKRSLAEITTFDFVLLLIISETTQASLADRNSSITSSLLLIVTMVGMDVGLSLLKRHSRGLEKALDSAPLVLVEDGALLKDRMTRARVDEGDILAAARTLRGLERLDQVKYAVLERNGGITIIPRERAEPEGRVTV